MCTVSFVRSANKTIITSNRDEHVARQAVEPKSQCINHKTIIFPKDPKAGGTWYALDEHGDVAVLLNGASEKHVWNPPYRKSRGLIVLDIISAASPFKGWQQIDLHDIEPFTLVLFEAGELYQLRWDAVVKETLKLNPEESHIWSSTTLYPKEIREKRARWFQDFMLKNRHPSQTDLISFHRYTEAGNTQDGLVINRNDFLKTVSITQTVIEGNTVSMTHHDLISNEVYPHIFTITE